MKCSDGMIYSAGGSPYITHHLLSIQTNYVMRHSRRIYTATIPSVRRISKAYLQLLPPSALLSFFFTTASKDARNYAIHTSCCCCCTCCTWLVSIYSLHCVLNLQWSRLPAAVIVLQRLSYKLYSCYNTMTTACTPSCSHRIVRIFVLSASVPSLIALCFVVRTNFIFVRAIRIMGLLINHNLIMQ